MAGQSPLDHADLREIEKTLDEGNTQEAAARLGQLGDARDHKDAIDFLTTRLLFQRGRIDSDGAADRVGAILDRVEHFPEAEDWLTELEARTERSALGDGFGKNRDRVEPDDTTENRAAPALPTLPPESQAPSISVGQPDPHHPFFDEVGPEDDITPTESGASEPEEEPEQEFRLDSSDPPPRPSAPLDAAPPWPEDELAADAPTSPGLRRARSVGSEPPTRPDLARPKRAAEPSTRPDLVRPDMGSEASAHPSYKPFDSLRAKEQLSARAGRYRGGINDPGEMLGGARKARPSAPARPSNRAAYDPERRIVEAFQMVREGSLEEARRLVPDEGSPLTQRPELRAMLGRVLLELGQAERAATEATLALEHAPQSAEVRLVFAWSAVRYARQRDDAWSLERVGRILKDMPQTAALDPGLLDALSACVEVRVGVPAVAMRLAQRALRNNADSVDALAALAEAAALCGEEQRAQTAFERLHNISEEAAEQLVPRLTRLGVGMRGPASSASVWLPLEHTLSNGAREVALAGLEALAAEAVNQRPPRPWEDPDSAGRHAAEFLALAPVLRHMGPFDLSLHGIERLEAGLDLVYGPGPRALDIDGASRTLWQLAGIYLGETLRSCCDGKWVGPPQQLEDAVLELLGGEVQPFQVVRRRILHGRHATLKASLTEALALAPPEAHGFRWSECPAPALPWGDGQWPEVDELPRFGRALGHSVVGAYALALGQPRLDRSGHSLTSIDHYLELVAPADSPLPEDAPWTRWLAVFLGAYLGEVLCREFGGNWSLGDRAGAESFVVNLGVRREMPLGVLFDTLTGRHPMSLADYLGQLRQTLGTT